MTVYLRLLFCFTCFSFIFPHDNNDELLRSEKVNMEKRNFYFPYKTFSLSPFPFSAAVVSGIFVKSAAVSELFWLTFIAICIVSKWNEIMSHNTRPNNSIFGCISLKKIQRTSARRYLRKFYWHLNFRALYIGHIFRFIPNVFAITLGKGDKTLFQSQNFKRYKAWCITSTQRIAFNHFLKYLLIQFVLVKWSA